MEGGGERRCCSFSRFFDLYINTSLPSLISPPSPPPPLDIFMYPTYRWEDHTVASTWQRAKSYPSNMAEAPFGKVTLSKLLVLKDRYAREDYFAQQAAFVTLEGRKDVRAVGI
jgi:hypothetical protein